MRRFTNLLIILLLLSSCANVLYYGYLPGGKYKYYQPLNKTELMQLKINLIVLYKRDDNSNIQCSDIKLDRNSELEGELGFQYFKNYCRAMIEFNNGIIDTNVQDNLIINLKGLSSSMNGFGYVKVYGLVEFDVNGLGINNKNYCSEMVDGDRDAPLKSYSITTRKDAFRKMVSGSARRALEELMQDIKKHSSARSKYYRQRR